jgi:putative glutamine amidotransferase
MMTPERPLILVSVQMTDTWGNYWSRVFSRPLVAVGALPVLLPIVEREADRRALLQRADGLLLGGGMDIEPHHYGSPTDPSLWDPDPLRDALELPLVREAAEMGTPMLGTCRGLQVINVALGGTLYLDNSHRPGVVNHPCGGVGGFTPIVDADLAGEPAPDEVTSHRVTTAPGTHLRAALGEEATVNSFHHQHVREPAPGLRVSAVADDGVVEAIESASGAPFAMGVQWEIQQGWRDPGQFALFELFAEHARTYLSERAPAESDR